MGMRRVSAKIEAEFSGKSTSTAGSPDPAAIPDHRDAPMVWVDVGSVTPWEKNPRVITDEAIKWLAGKIRIHGFINPIIIWPVNGVMYAGHLRIKSAKLLGLTEVPARFINFPDEKSAIEFGLADNRANEQVPWSQEKLADLFAGELEAVDPEEIEASAGFAAEEREGLLRGWNIPTNDPAREWEGMPEYKHEDQTSFRRIVVHFKSNEAAEEFGRLIRQSVSERTRSLWYPLDEIGHIADKRYGEEGEAFETEVGGGFRRVKGQSDE